jgi:membrane protein required for colicin V production
MHWFDVGAGIALLIGSVWSFFRGLVREVLAILGIVAAFVLASRGHPYVARHLEMDISHPWLRQAIGFALIFLASVVLYVAFAMLLHRLVKAAGLSLPNRFLGGIFGLVKVGVILSVLCLMTAQLFPDFATRLARESLLAPTFFRTAALLSMLLPESVTKEFQRFPRHLWQQLPAWSPPPSPAATPRQPSPSPPAPPLPSGSETSERDAQPLEQLLRQRLLPQQGAVATRAWH